MSDYIYTANPNTCRPIMLHGSWCRWANYPSYLPSAGDLARREIDAEAVKYVKGKNNYRQWAEIKPSDGPWTYIVPVCVKCNPIGPDYFIEERRKERKANEQQAKINYQNRLLANMSEKTLGTLLARLKKAMSMKHETVTLEGGETTEVVRMVLDEDYVKRWVLAEALRIGVGIKKELDEAAAKAAEPESDGNGAAA